MVIELNRRCIMNSGQPNRINAGSVELFRIETRKRVHCTSNRKLIQRGLVAPRHSVQLLKLERELNLHVFLARIDAESDRLFHHQPMLAPFIFGVNIGIE